MWNPSPKLLCSSIQIENMKTIRKVLKIFCVSLSFGASASTRWNLLFAIIVLIYLFVSILHVAAHLPTLAQQSQQHQSHQTPSLRASDNQICTLLTLLTFTPRGRCAPPWWNVCWEVENGAIGIVALSVSLASGLWVQVRARALTPSVSACIKLVLWITFYHLLDVM